MFGTPRGLDFCGFGIVVEGLGFESPRSRLVLAGPAPIFLSLITGAGVPAVLEYAPERAANGLGLGLCAKVLCVTNLSRPAQNLLLTGATNLDAEVI